jgi:hypothetical protein
MVVSLQAQQPRVPEVTIGSTDLGGVVTSPSGPQAGVWVIAETTDLPTKFAKMVVTDDLGRYVIPELPKATYNVWVRGYGLVDSRNTTLPGRFESGRRCCHKPQPQNTIRCLLVFDDANSRQK